MERRDQLSAKEVEDMAWQYQTHGGGRTTALGRDKFPVLTTMATLLRVIGWLAVAGGALLFFVEVMPWISCVSGMGRPSQRGMMSGVSCGVAVLILAPMIGALVGGFCMIVLGELIGVFRAIEGNTHQLIGSVEQTWHQIKLAGNGEQR